MSAVQGELDGDVVIRTPDQRLRIFVSSTLGELADERQAVLRASEALGADRFEEAFSAGVRLNQRDAVAAVRDRRGAGS